VIWLYTLPENNEQILPVNTKQFCPSREDLIQLISDQYKDEEDDNIVPERSRRR
jgi:hypothetical protein